MMVVASPPKTGYKYSNYLLESSADFINYPVPDQDRQTKRAEVQLPVMVVATPPKTLQRPGYK